ncbi:DUF2637 domain-containing protein [Tsukamurella pulmonis]|uniref:DUF2637 domain-containing protein n=1 Tax=Tsukamurella pulmonis TaxID=47312 RepID=UPI001EDDE9F2|nr:DUF2637 domain-containing protein [Tsukamurella pulmonis]
MTNPIQSVRRFLWGLLVLGTAASIAANVAHAHPEWGPRIMAVAAPVALLAFTHLAGLWGRIRTSGVTYYAILMATAAIAAGAARVSFAAVRDLAVSYGYGPLDAALIPLMLDGGLAVTALALVVLGRIEAEAATTRQAKPAQADAPDPSVQAPEYSAGLTWMAPVHRLPERPVHQATETAPAPASDTDAPAVTSDDGAMHRPAAAVHQVPDTEPERPRIAAVRAHAPAQSTAPSQPVRQRTTDPEQVPVVQPVHREQAEVVVQAGASELPVETIAAVYARLDAGHSQTAIDRAKVANKRTVAKLIAARAELAAEVSAPALA